MIGYGIRWIDKLINANFQKDLVNLIWLNAAKTHKTFFSTIQVLDKAVIVGR